MSYRIRKDFSIGLLLLMCLLPSAAAGPLLSPPELRIASSWQDAAYVRLVATAWYLPAPAWTRASRMEFSIGLLDGPDRTRPFAAMGPVWRLNSPEEPVFVEFGFSPTVLGGSTLGNLDLGGNLHFTSSLALGRDFGPGPIARIALRIQHLSNGGLHDRNPGLDLGGLTFTGRFGQP